MAIGLVQELRSAQIQTASPWEGVPSSFEPEKIMIVAFRLWRRANCLDIAEDECTCCKGEAQQCYATCR